MSKFASVQDRLREWRPDVLEKIKRMSCMQIAMFDIDGFRMDKGLQTTVDAMAEFADYQRQCARKYGKDNFLIVGEVVGDPNLASVYIGRGKQPDQALTTTKDSVTASNETDPDTFIRPFGMSALDGAAFHYDIYGAMTRFLGLDGPWGARGVDWVEQWNFMLTHNDMVNANTGEYDPRHMFGMTNHDVFRWPALANGTQRQLLGLFVTMLELPGIPMILWGEEQEFYVLENFTFDYVFGRTPMGSSSAWQLHGCYNLGEDVYVDIPFNSSAYGCYDDSVSLDHRDPAKFMRNVLKRMFELRQQYPVLNDGYNLTSLSSKIYDIYLPGSKGIPSPHGIWSVYRGRSENVQDFTGIGQENQGIWLLYSNENKSVTYEFDCKSSNESIALISAFPAHTTIKNLFYPYEEFTLESSVIRYGIEGSTEFSGCLSQLETAAWDYKAFVPKDKWLRPGPTITKTVPSHDARLKSTVAYDESETMPIEIHFSSEMSCDSIAGGIEVDSTTQNGHQARLDKGSIGCALLDGDPPRHVGEIPSAWAFKATLDNVSNGVHTVTIRNASTEDGKLSTNTVDRFMFRIGQPDNPMVFVKSANYSTTLLHRDAATGGLYISPRAAGADKIRYSRNWGSSFSKWIDYTGDNIALQAQPWSGTKEQEWVGEHVIVHYWSQKTGSSDHVQHADLERNGLPPRRFPHVFVHGDFNEYGYDGGIPNDMQLDLDGLWKYDLAADFPNSIIFNVWGMNPDGVPDKSRALGDVNGDNVLDWVPPDTLAKNLVTISDPPAKGHLGHRLVVNDGTYRYHLTPIGSSTNQVVLSVLLGLFPIITATLGIWMFMRLFYRVKFNRTGIDAKNGVLGFMKSIKSEKEKSRGTTTNLANESRDAESVSSISPSAGGTMVNTGTRRRTVLIATLEYEIEDWEIKIKIGGLGVMSSLMGKHLGHHDLVWVVPCIGGIEYPSDASMLPSLTEKQIICSRLLISVPVAYPMDVTILGQKYEISVQYHMLNNITFVLLDAPIFRKHSKADPYPARMDDLESAIFYSAWNQCIALAIERFNIDIYHINDYHGAAAPLYLLPKVIPCCLSLHNAEFQGEH
jgi:alpha-1,3-glucan synthase